MHHLESLEWVTIQKMAGNGMKRTLEVLTVFNKQREHSFHELCILEKCYEHHETRRKEK
jgi:hypothetical protein